jgi:hypothetical protein
MGETREIVSIVGRLRQGRLAALIAGAAACVGAWAAAAVLVAAALSAPLGWGWAAACAAALAALAAYALWRFWGRGAAGQAGLSGAVRAAEASAPELRRRLGPAYHVARGAPAARGTSPGLADAFVRGVERRVPAALRAPLPRRLSYLPFGLLSAALAAWLVVGLGAPGFLGDRFTALAEASPVRGGLIAGVSPGDARVGVGATLTVEATLREDFAGAAAVVVERGGEKVETPMGSRGPRKLAAVVKAGAEDFRYYVTAGGEKSRRFNVEVVPPPSFGELHVTVTPPAYAGLPARALSPGEGYVRSLPGSAVGVNVKVEGGEAVEAEAPGDVRAPLAREGDTYTGGFTLTRAGVYRLRATSPWGSAATPYFGLDLDADNPPEVVVLEPARDLIITDTARSPRVRFACADDFGLGDVRVVYYDEATGKRLVGEVGSGSGRAEVEGEADLIPSGLELFPGTVVSYYVEAFDNDTVNGPKAGRSTTYRFRFPSAAEMFEQVNDEMTAGVSDLEGLRAETRRLREQLRDAGAGRGDTPSRHELRELAAEHERLRRDLLEATERLEAMLDRAEDNVLSPELAAKMLEAQKLLNEALDEESKEALRKLSEALREVDPERVRELMAQVKLDQAEMEKRLERVIEILKEAQREELLRNLALRAEELADSQRDVAARLEDADAASRQRDIAADIPSLAEDAGETARTFDEVDAEVAARLRELAEELAEGRGRRAAEAAAGDLARGDLEAAAGEAEVSQSELEDIAAALRDLAESYREGKRQALLADMDRAIERVLGASHRAEALAVELAGGEVGAGFAGRQENLASEVGSIAEEAGAAAAKSLLVPTAVSEALVDIGGEVEAGAKNYELGNLRAAAEADVRALAGLNIVAAVLLEARANVATAGSSMGLAEMIERMKTLAGAQSQVNRQGQSMLSMMPGMSPSELRMALERLAAEQALIRRGLQKLASEGRGRGAEKAGNLGGLVKDMEELERELEAGRLDERLVEKQEKLLERMLSSTRALRVQGRSSRRQAEPARDYTTPTVAPLPGSLTAPRAEAGPASGPPAAGYVPADLRGAAADFYRRLAGGD